jgi:hypothetical protein
MKVMAYNLYLEIWNTSYDQRMLGIKLLQINNLIPNH